MHVQKELNYFKTSKSGAPPSNQSAQESMVALERRAKDVCRATCKRWVRGGYSPGSLISPHDAEKAMEGYAGSAFAVHCRVSALVRPVGCRARPHLGGDVCIEILLLLRHLHQLSCVIKYPVISLGEDPLIIAVRTSGIISFPKVI